MGVPTRTWCWRPPRLTSTPPNQQPAERLARPTWAPSQAVKAPREPHCSAKAFIANANLGSADSAACTAGAKGFLGSTSGSNNVLTAMEAFINSGESGVAPVCTAAAEAYIDAKIANSSDEDALTSAASAYIAAISANPGSGQGCLDAASQFIGN